jgi:hypothetical protein
MVRLALALALLCALASAATPKQLNEHQKRSANVLQNPSFTSLKHWTKNQNAELFWKGVHSVEVLSKQSTSTPGIKQTRVQVQKGKVYTFQVVGRSEVPARLWVENTDGGEVVWDASPVLQKVQSEMSVSFLATDEFINLGVLFDVPRVGAIMSLQKVQLRLATSAEIKGLAAQIRMNQAGKLFNGNFLEGVEGWEKNDNVKMVVTRTANVGSDTYTQGRMAVASMQSDGTPGIRQNAIALEKNQVYTLTVKGYTKSKALLAQPWVQDAITGEDLVWAASTPLTGKSSTVEVTFLAETDQVNVGVLMNRPTKGQKMVIQKMSLAVSNDEQRRYIQQEIELHRHSRVFNADFSSEHWGWWPNQHCELEVKKNQLVVTNKQTGSTPGVRQDGIYVQKGKMYTMSVEGYTNARKAKAWVQESGTRRDIVWATAPQLTKKNKLLQMDFIATADRINVGVLFSSMQKGDKMWLKHISIKPKGWGCTHVTCRYQRNSKGEHAVRIFHNNNEEYGTKHVCQYNRNTRACGCECL